MPVSLTAPVLVRPAKAYTQTFLTTYSLLGTVEAKEWVETGVLLSELYLSRRKRHIYTSVDIRKTVVRP